MGILNDHKFISYYGTSIYDFICIYDNMYDVPTHIYDVIYEHYCHG